jgi:hypothetical protein
MNNKKRMPYPCRFVIRGPITTGDDTTYLFVNKFSDLDFYLEMKKGKDGWYQSGGPEIQHPQSMVNELGYYIDKFLMENPILNKTDLS